MRTAFILSFVANLAVCVVSYVACPEEVAIHFGSGGEPDNWAPAWINALLIGGVNVLLFASIYFSPHLMRVLPRGLVNLPNRDYCMKDENWPKAEALLSTWMYLFGTVMMAFMLIVGLLALDANLSEPVRFREEIFWWPFGLFMAFTVGWSLLMFRVFRIPAGEECR